MRHPPNPPSLPVHWGTLGKSQPLLALFPNWKWKGVDKLARTNSEFLPTPIILFQEEQAGDLGNFGAQMKMCKAWGWGGSVVIREELEKPVAPQGPASHLASASSGQGLEVTPVAQENPTRSDAAAGLGGGV